MNALLIGFVNPIVGTAHGADLGGGSVLLKGHLSTLVSGPVIWARSMQIVWGCYFVAIFETDMRFQGAMHR